ncbi:toxin [Streptomyces qinglanensis]|uniref:Toxin n=1 Tax=Streptomyces qinglanensis TaxID=943816 RepID=A0A1E7K7C8_9ACTN|nr:MULTISPECIES: DUF397 domain-containing protein [Streptomyces]OEU99795.1 toxin [Streptomyces qinglanensis]OEV27441.1 toxin [Streptomyces nanshensis]
MANTEIDLQQAVWRKSSYSNGSGGECVEVAVETVDASVPVRDTKTAPHGPVLTFPTAQWAHFISTLHEGNVNA